MPVKSAFNKKPLITLGIIALLLIGIIFINVSCSAKMDKPQTQTTPTVEQSKPTESKPEVKPEPKEETGNTIVEEESTVENKTEDVIKPYQLPVLDIKTKLGLTRDDKDNKVVSYFNTASKNGKFKRVMYYICLLYTSPSPRD